MDDVTFLTWKVDSCINSQFSLVFIQILRCIFQIKLCYLLIAADADANEPTSEQTNIETEYPFLFALLEVTDVVFGAAAPGIEAPKSYLQNTVIN